MRRQPLKKKSDQTGGLTEGNEATQRVPLADHITRLLEEGVLDRCVALGVIHTIHVPGSSGGLHVLHKQKLTLSYLLESCTRVFMPAAQPVHSSSPARLCCSSTLLECAAVRSLLLPLLPLPAYFPFQPPSSCLGIKEFAAIAEFGTHTHCPVTAYTSQRLCVPQARVHANSEQLLPADHHSPLLHGGRLDGAALHGGGAKGHFKGVVGWGGGVV